MKIETEIYRGVSGGKLYIIKCFEDKKFHHFAFYESIGILRFTQDDIPERNRKPVMPFLINLQKV
jgi:hypothetical protein